VKLWLGFMINLFIQSMHIIQGNHYEIQGQYNMEKACHTHGCGCKIMQQISI